MLKLIILLHLEPFNKINLYVKIFNLAIIKYFLYNNFRHIYMPG